jgi:hypothetical protein
MASECPDCGGHRFVIEFDRPSGLGGVIRHLNHEGVACELRTEDAVPVIAGAVKAEATSIPSPKPGVKSAPSIASPEFVVESSDPGLGYILFKSSISCGQHGELNSWSRNKHPHIGAHVEGAWVILTFGNERRRVPIHNIQYLSEKIVQ